MLGLRRLGQWFSWPPSEVMNLPYRMFVDLIVDEAEERSRRN